MSQKTRSYFKGKKTYSGDQLHFMDSIAYKLDTDDTAQEEVQGLVKLATDANAILRADNTDNFQGVLRPHQLPELVLAVGGSHVAGTAIEVGALKLTPLNYDTGKREDWKLEVQTGKPSSIVTATDMDVLHIDTTDDNGIYLKADSTEFSQGTGNKLELGANGIAPDKIELFSGGNLVLLTDVTGAIVEGSASDDQVNALATLGASKIVVTDLTGLMTPSTLPVANLDFLDVSVGVASNSKAVVLSAAGKIDTIDVTALKLAGSALAATAPELDVLAGVTPGTTSAGKALVVDGSKQIDYLDVLTTLKLGGIEIIASAADLNLMFGVQATVSNDDMKTLAGTAIAGVTSADMAELANASIGGMKPSVLKSGSNHQSMQVRLSFITSGNKYKLRIPWDCTITYCSLYVEETIGITTDGEILFKDGSNNNMSGSNLTAGVLTITAGAGGGVFFETTLTLNNSFSEGDIITLDCQKGATLGGTVFGSLDFTLDD